MKTIYFKLPEYYVIALAVLAGYTPPFYVNPICIAVVVFLIFQIISKNRVTGSILSIILFFANLYFIAAVLSEFMEFTEFTTEAKQLLFMGILIWTVNFIASVLMFLKYVFGMPNKPLAVKIKTLILDK